MAKSPQDNKEIPKIKVLNITELEDGSSDISFEVSDDFIEMVKLEKNLEEVSQEVLSEYVNELLTKCVDGEDGYGYEKNFRENTET